MKTDQLIHALAQGAGPVRTGPVARRLMPALLLGGGLTVALALTIGSWVGASVMGSAGWWLKWGYSAALAVLGCLAVAALGRPAVSARRPALALALVVLLMLGLGLSEMAAVAPEQRMTLWLGHSAADCPYRVFGLSLPALAGTLWALKGLAPTRPRLAGLAAGLVAGGVGASAYALTCTEVAMSFVATWYSLGIAAAGLLGAVLGPRVLRW
jgi:hypothetical protein